MEIVKTYTDMEEYMQSMKQKKIDDVYKNAVNEAIESKTEEELIAEYCSNICDLECELEIQEEMFNKNGSMKKEMILTKRKLTKARNELNNLIREEGI